MEYDAREGLWREVVVRQSSSLPVKLQVAAKAYRDFGANIQQELGRPVTCMAIADMGVQIDVISWATLKAMRIKESELLPVQYGIMGAVRSS